MLQIIACWRNLYDNEIPQWVKDSGIKIKKNGTLKAKNGQTCVQGDWIFIDQKGKLFTCPDSIISPGIKS